MTFIPLKPKVKAKAKTSQVKCTKNIKTNHNNNSSVKWLSDQVTENSYRVEKPKVPNPGLWFK